MSRVRLGAVAGFAAVAVCLSGGWARAADEKPDAPHHHHGGAGLMALGKLELLRSDKVQKELVLTDQQRESLHQFAEDIREQIGKGREEFQKLSPEERRAKLSGVFAERQKVIQKKLDDILTTPQRQRLDELELQLRGPAALYQKDVADALQLTDEQKKKLDDLRAEQVGQFHKWHDAFRNGDRDSVREKMQKARKEAREALMAVLTSEQREKFEKMQGAKFEFDASLLSTFHGGFGERGRHGPPGEKKPDSKPKSSDAKTSTDGN